MSEGHAKVGSSASAKVQTVAGMDPADAVRLVDLKPGQQVTATVLATSADGMVRIGMFGARINAFSHLALEVGKSYQFDVAAIEPQIILSAARPVRVPNFTSASSAGLLGVPSAQLTLPFLELSQTLAAVSESQATASKALRSLVEALSSGLASPEDLQTLHRSLGHDQEARVLRLGRISVEKAGAEVVQLRQTLKAMILALIEPSAAQARKRMSHDLGAQLLAGLNQIEVENAQRSEQGAPLYVPLPIVPGSNLLDARLFFFPPPVGGDKGAGVDQTLREWSIVLLLEFTRLGAMRVDIKVRGDRVAVDFQLAEYGPSIELRDALSQLEVELEEVGLDVQGLSLRHATAPELPIADLILPPPRASDPAARVDLHV